MINNRIFSKLFLHIITYGQQFGILESWGIKNILLSLIIQTCFFLLKNSVTHMQFYEIKLDINKNKIMIKQAKAYLY